MGLKQTSIGVALASLFLMNHSAALAKDLVLGLIPAENNEQMIKNFEPMRVYLEKKVGQKVKVFTATDYTGVIEAMRKGRVDVAFFGPLSYILAEQESGAEAFAVGVLKSGKSTYRSIIIVPADSPAKTIQDLKGKSVAFVDPVSTSGGLMPTFMVKQATGMMPEQFFGKFTYAGSHDAAELAVKNRTVDAAADNDVTYGMMLDKGLISKQSNRILAESADMPGSPLAYRKNLPEALKARIRNAMVNAHKEINVSGYGNLLRYDAATPADYQSVRNLAKELGLTKEQLLK
jgi:phosphonate transport system substrate-binding protein